MCRCSSGERREGGYRRSVVGCDVSIEVIFDKGDWLGCDNMKEKDSDSIV